MYVHVCTSTFMYANMYVYLCVHVFMCPLALNVYENMLLCALNALYNFAHIDNRLILSIFHLYLSYFQHSRLSAYYIYKQQNVLVKCIYVYTDMSMNACMHVS